MTRLLDPRATKKSVNWEGLMQQAIQRATRLKDSRLRMLQAAASEGRSAIVLKKMGIVGEADLAREFPND
jgi:hypothetical protein